MLTLLLNEQLESTSNKLNEPLIKPCPQSVLIFQTQECSAFKILERYSLIILVPIYQITE